MKAIINANRNRSTPRSKTNPVDELPTNHKENTLPTTDALAMLAATMGNEPEDALIFWKHCWDILNIEQCEEAYHAHINERLPIREAMKKVGVSAQKNKGISRTVFNKYLHEYWSKYLTGDKLKARLYEMKMEGVPIDVIWEIDSEYHSRNKERGRNNRLKLSGSRKES